MNRQRLHIAIMVNSQIIYEGVYAILSQSDIGCIICKVDSLDDLEEILPSRRVDLLIVNPLLLVNREKEIKRIRKNHPDFSIVGIHLGIVDNQSLALLDSSFTLFDTAEQILSRLEKTGTGNESKLPTNDDNLTERELDVLTQLVHGHSNKEIADSLNISIHTVMTHRKNIAAKTGIRSQSGLTIYAISKKIVQIEDVSPQAH
ncbi:MULTISPECIES: helix-turn-helix transcriptional regulator [Petrimonas]|jgi:DNA-binding NarL/FixJ family response regulator|uniref:Transcriptional regulatory protein MctR n=1 Tax=Petrimonas mucosa TaxID=1642646 RepID=A0A1G4G5H1_9BACT|nr:MULTISPECIES: LuxR C-terminal-related transcriptional regulator [Petrimonas]MDD3560914.1 LuxR C-terminal-related transcriptional regulator [Petrimonas mucosa]SCM56599.1 Transcriptional regulatory protein MctR {ECO:0000305} [Petrimonas mucosa]SFU57387.1 DNA-binding response regulator, NarL/FixJ family, contains REC and HTH domains [Porphyromonadaceae bacterium KHP3R9]HHT29906.1 response regulator transcription factor [Petrimonas mucosa]